MHVTNGLVMGLPASVTELTVMYEADKPALATFQEGVAQVAAFNRWFRCFQGCLTHLALDVRLLAYCLTYPPAYQTPCVHTVCDLRLALVGKCQYSLSPWCPGLFGQLQNLQLDLNGCAAPVCNLSSCPSLKRLSIYSHHTYGGLHLRGITGVTAELVELHLDSMADSNPFLDCTTWTTPRVHIYYRAPGINGGLPWWVVKALGPLRSMRQASVIMVNDIPAAAAEAIAAERAEAKAEADALAFAAAMKAAKEARMATAYRSDDDSMLDDGM